MNEIDWTKLKRKEKCINEKHLGKKAFFIKLIHSGGLHLIILKNKHLFESAST